MSGRVVRPASAFTSLVPQTKLQRQRSAAAERYRDKVRALVKERDLFRCVRCGEVGTEVHHRMNLGAGGSNAIPAEAHKGSRMVLLCGDDHRWVGANPRLAEGEGLLVRRGVIRCDEVPVLYRGQLVLLTDDFQILEAEGVS